MNKFMNISTDPSTAAAGPSIPEPKVPFSDPTPEMLNLPEFEAIWQAIKRWDINVPGAYHGHCGATGNHVRVILDAVRQSQIPQTRDAAVMSINWIDPNGRPDGGHSFGVGFMIAWQRWPMIVDGKPIPQTGAFVEHVLAAVLDRLQFLQKTSFACQETVTAIEHVNKAMEAIQDRIKRRQAEGGLGTHTGK